MSPAAPLVRIMRLPGADHDVPIPGYQTAGAAGADICSNLDPEDRARGLLLAPGERRVIQTGIALEIPPGYEVQVRPRSGLALRHGLTLPNTPGTIDSDYRGPLGVLLVNLGAEPVAIVHGMRIAQLVVAPVVQARFEITETLTETERGAGGFGSTGV